MDPVRTCDVLLSYLKRSNLNFHLTESPFSASIEIRKTFVKDKNGVYRTSNLPMLFKEETNVLDDDKDALIKENESLYIQLQSSQNDIANLEVEINQLQINQKILEKDNDDLRKALEEKALEMASVKKCVTDLKAVNNAIKHDIEQANNTVKNKDEEIAKAENILSNFKVLKFELSNENIKLREELAAKEDELGDALKEKEKLDEKVNSLLDVLYGCCECGLHKCECNDFVEEEESSPHPISDPPSPPAQATSACHPPPLSTGSPPWTPPPTPPCTSCGGVNFGPSPSSICFGCIPPLQSECPPNSSTPSTTPPGTPPRLR